MRRKVVIIPDERQILADSFERDVYYGEDHVEVYQEFSDKYRLGYSFLKDDSQHASLEIARLGHFSYKTENDAGIIIFYLPKEITDQQLNYFETHQYDFFSWNMVGAYSFSEDNDEKEVVSLKGLSTILQTMRVKNQLFHSNQVNLKGR